MPLTTKDKGSGQIDIPMSAMIDVVFLLLIYFIWTYQIEAPEAHLVVNLPGKPDTVQQPPERPPLELKVYKDNYYFRERVVSLYTIRRTLTTIGEADPDVTVIIQVSELAPTANLVRLLDRCKAAGLTNLNVVTL